MFNQNDKQRNNLMQSTADIKSHYKMYKSGKNWLIAAITAITFGVLIGGSPVVASATTQAPAVQTVQAKDNVQPAVSTTSSQTDAANTATTDSSATGTTPKNESDTQSTATTSESTTTVDKTADKSSDANATSDEQVGTTKQAASTATEGAVVTPNKTDTTSTQSNNVTTTNNQQVTQNDLGSASADKVTAAKSAAAAAYNSTGVAQKVTASDPQAATATLNVHMVNALTGEPITYTSDKGKTINGVIQYTTTVASPKGEETFAQQQAVPIRGYVQDTDDTVIPTTFTDGVQDVTLYYTPLSDVVVKVVDQSTNKVLFSNTWEAAYQFGTTFKNEYRGQDGVQDDPVNKTTRQDYDVAATPADAYDVTGMKIDIPGFTYVSTSGNPTGTFSQTQTKDSKNPNVITYYYTPNTGQDATAADNAITTPKKVLSFNLPSGLVGYTNTKYDFTAQLDAWQQNLEKQGYTLLGHSGDTKGIWLLNGEGYQYYFVANQPVTVQYYDDTDGTVLNQVVLGADGKVPTGDYTTTQQNFDGYTFTGVTGQTTGTYGPFASTVTYHYTKNPVNTGSTITPTGPDTTPTGSTTTPTQPSGTTGTTTPTNPTQPGLPDTFGGSGTDNGTSTTDNSGHNGSNNPSLPDTFGGSDHTVATTGRNASYGRYGRIAAAGRTANKSRSYVASHNKSVSGAQLAKRTTLPQTGDQTNKSLTIAGVAIAAASLIGLLGMAGSRRRSI